MSDKFLHVLVGDHVAGLLTREGSGRLSLRYDEDYRASSRATPLSLSMPLEVSMHHDSVVTPWLWGLLPDNDGVLERWARHFHVSSSSVFSLLATPVGEDCAGAVRVVSPDRLDASLARSGSVEWLSDDEVGQRLGDLRRDATSWLGRDFAGRFSLAGAQAKMALTHQQGRWGLPRGSTPTTHILKPAVVGLDDHDLNEHMCLSAAQRAGLVAASSTLGHFAGETAIVVERYDRLRVGDSVSRVHQEDLCQALAVPPRVKYQADGGPGVADVASLVTRAWDSTHAAIDRERFCDALAWNWIIAGTDAHAKNYSLLLDARQVRLAPLYDIASALPYGVNEHKLRFAMKIGSDYDVYVRRNPWPVVARDLGLSYDNVRPRVLRLLNIAADAMSDAARVPDIASLASDLPTRLVTLVAERASLLTRLL